MVSHNHYDHLDLDSIGALPNRDRITAVVPLGLGPDFTERGYGRVVELDWHESTEAAGLTFTALPTIHWSNRLFTGEERVPCGRLSPSKARAAPVSTSAAIRNTARFSRTSAPATTISTLR